MFMQKANCPRKPDKAEDPYVRVNLDSEIMITARILLDAEALEKIPIEAVRIMSNTGGLHCCNKQNENAFELFPTASQLGTSFFTFKKTA